MYEDGNIFAVRNFENQVNNLPSPSLPICIDCISVPPHFPMSFLNAGRGLQGGYLSSVFPQSQRAMCKNARSESTPQQSDHTVLIFLESASV